MGVKRVIRRGPNQGLHVMDNGLGLSGPANAAGRCDYCPVGSAIEIIWWEPVARDRFTPVRGLLLCERHAREYLAARGLPMHGKETP